MALYQFSVFSMSPSSPPVQYRELSSSVGAEAGAIAAVMAEKLPMLNAGMVSDVDAAADEFVKALEKACDEHFRRTVE